MGVFYMDDGPTGLGYGGAYMIILPSPHSNFTCVSTSFTPQSLHLHFGKNFTPQQLHLHFGENFTAEQ